MKPRVHLRNRETGQYFVGPNGWVGNCARAHDFGAVENAAQLARTEKLIPERTCWSTSSRRWLSNSFKTSDALMPPAATCRRQGPNPRVLAGCGPLQYGMAQSIRMISLASAFTF